MTKYSLTILCLLLFTLTVQEVHSSSLDFLTNAFASDNGETIIWKDASGFYVEADLFYKAYSNINVTKMLISFSNAETVLAEDCLGFDHYDCSKHDCTKQGTMMFIHYPNFMTWGHAANAALYVDYSNWNLNTRAYLGSTCQTSASATFGKARGGVLGLGFPGDNMRNYVGSKVFSIYLKPGFTGGKLLWKFDSSLANSNKLVSLGTDENWKVSLKGTGFVVGLASVSLSAYSLVFDIHSDAIGFPLAAFNSVMEKFQQYSGVKCTADKYKPKCDLYGEIAKLPEISFTFGTTVLKIPTEIYLEDSTQPRQNVITLNFKALDPDLLNENFVSPSFKDTVILDAHFMKYYYTVFDASQKQISLYLQGEPSSPSMLIYIVIGVVVLLLIIGATAVYFIKKKKSSNASLRVPDYSADLPGGPSNHSYQIIQKP